MPARHLLGTKDVARCVHRTLFFTRFDMNIGRKAAMVKDTFERMARDKYGQYPLTNQGLTIGPFSCFGRLFLHLLHSASLMRATSIARRIFIGNRGCRNGVN